MVRPNTAVGTDPNQEVADANVDRDEDEAELQGESEAPIEAEEKQIDHQFDKQGRTGKNKGGSEPTVTGEQIANLMMDLHDGLSRKDACECQGVSVGWLVKKAQFDPEFARQLHIAEIHCKRHHLQRVRDGGSGWQSSAWFLERKWRKEFSLTSPDPDEAERTLRIRRIVRERNPAPTCEPVGREPLQSGKARGRGLV